MEQNSKLAEYMRKQLGRGAILGRAKGSSGPFSAWHRDIGQCWNLITTEAVSAASAILEEKYEDEDLHDALEALDTITKMLIGIYTDSISDNLAGIKKFKELYEYLDESALNKEVYALFSGYFVQTFYLYMFTSMEMAVGLPQTINQDVLDYSSVMTVLSSLSHDTRKTVMQELMGEGLMPTTVDYSKLLKRTEPFLDVIKQDQQRQYEKMKRREENA